MLVNELIADEGLFSDFAFSVQVLSDDVEIPLKDAQGKIKPFLNKP